jgi:2,4-dienoyl-CoA reductase-like NADH-dependent reductase (Old Yellow Enzyme family)
MPNFPLEALFRPFRCKSLQLRNRIAMASLARWSSPDGNPLPLAGYYTRRAMGGAALVFTEGAAIDRPASCNDSRNARIFGEALEGWRRVVDAVHAAGAKIVPQLWHAGAVAKKASTWSPPGEPESPSGLASADQPRGRAMTEGDLADVLLAYRKATEDACSVGFDAIEVHAGHGYLLDQFFWSETNRRSDRWGGKTLAERSRFPLEVVRDVRRAAPPDMPLMLRISHWKSADLSARYVETPAEIEAWLLPFAEAGVDIFSVSELRYDTPLFANSPLSFAGWVKKMTGCPVIAAGGIGTSGDFMSTFGGEIARPQSLDDVARRIEAEEFDLVAVGRALIADPEWVRKVKEGRTSELQDCTVEHLAPSAAN